MYVIALCSVSVSLYLCKFSMVDSVSIVLYCFVLYCILSRVGIKRRIVSRVSIKRRIVSRVSIEYRIVSRVSIKRCIVSRVRTMCN